MLDFLIRCSSLGKIMTEPKTKAEGILSKGAKTYIRTLVAQEIFGVEFQVSSKYMEKGTICEDQSIGLLNRVRGLDLSKNTERRTDGFITGECDLFDASARRGHDLKTAWSIATFPILAVDAEDRDYEWQMRGYMALWDADEWEVNHALVDTPEVLIGYEPMELHIVSHIPENLRLTTWTVRRDRELESLMLLKVTAAREYAQEVLREFDRTHAIAGLADKGAPWVSDAHAASPPPAPKTAAAPAKTEALPELF